MSSGSSVIIVSFNSAETIAACVGSVLTTLGSDDDVFIVDNASRDDTLDILERMEKSGAGKITLLNQTKNLGFAKACNMGVALSQKEYVVLLNPDTYVFGDWLSRLQGHFQFYDRTGAVGPLSNCAIQSQHILRYFPAYHDYRERPLEMMKELRHQYKLRSVPNKLLIGFCLMLRRDLLESLGGLDEDFFLGMEDLELSWRLRENGYFLRVALDVFVAHAGQTSFRTVDKTQTDRHIKAGADVLYRKMSAHYHPQPIPHPHEYFGIDWWRPSVLKSESTDVIFANRNSKLNRHRIIQEIKSLLQKRQCHEARSLLNEALKIHVADYALWYTLGSTCAAMGDLDEAEFALKNAWALEFRTSRAWNRLLELQHRNGLTRDPHTLPIVENV